MLSNLTAEQRNSLQAMPQVLGLAADIAHAAVTIYLPGENKKFFNVYKQEQPMTQVGNVRPDMTSRSLRVCCKKMCLLTASVNGLWACSTV